MKKYNHPFQILAFLICLLLKDISSFSCSMFKITIYGKTMVGNNEDAWRLDSKIWFEPGTNGKYGSAYVGHNDLFPQGAMNEMGLVYDGFAVYPRQLKPVKGKLPIEDPASFLRMIMQKCKTVEEVHKLVNKYDRSIFNHSMILFIDKTGEYLILEVDTVLTGNNREYVLANFCPSTTNPNDVKIPRFIRGNKFLKDNVPDSSLQFCLSVMDTMHECRGKIGDGTTYTSIYDLQEGIIYLYFYHDFKHVVKFNLQQELGKGNHIIRMLDIFPPNPEYQKFAEYKTPFNSLVLRLGFYALMVFYIVSLFFYRSASRRVRLLENKNIRYRQGKYLLWTYISINSILLFYLYTLLKNQPMYYFDSPYRFDNDNILNMISYFPFILLASVVPIIYFSIQTIRRSADRKCINWILLFNSLSYIFLLMLFGYWGFFKVF